MTTFRPHINNNDSSRPHLSWRGDIKGFETSAVNSFAETMYSAIVRGGGPRPPRSSFLTHAGRQVSALARLLSPTNWADELVTEGNMKG